MRPLPSMTSFFKGLRTALLIFTIITTMGCSTSAPDDSEVPNSAAVDTAGCKTFIDKLDPLVLQVAESVTYFLDNQDQTSLDQVSKAYSQLIAETSAVVSSNSREQELFDSWLAYLDLQREIYGRGVIALQDAGVSQVLSDYKLEEFKIYMQLHTLCNN